VTASVTKIDSPRTSLATALLLMLPGLALLFAIGYAGKCIESWIKQYGISHHKALPNIEYVLWAILIGALIGNAFGGARWFKIFAPGIATYEFLAQAGHRAPGGTVFCFATWRSWAA